MTPRLSSRLRGNKITATLIHSPPLAMTSITTYAAESYGAVANSIGRE
jgi:hypothetical protein